MKLYLISREQFTALVNYYNKTEIKNIQFEELKTINSSYKISDQVYGRIVKLGQLDGIDIFSLTCPDLNINLFDKIEKTSHLLDYLKLLYNGLKQSFPSYSEHIILYYLYKRPGINGIFNTKHFIELCGLTEKYYWKKSAASTATEPRSVVSPSEPEELIVKIGRAQV